jgi:hypothetical protein
LHAFFPDNITLVSRAIDVVQINSKSEETNERGERLKMAEVDGY